MSRRQPLSNPEVRRTRRPRWLILCGVLAAFLIAWGLWEWSVAQSLSRARAELVRDPRRAEQIAADATLFWSLQRDTAWVVRAQCYLQSRAIPEAYGCWAQVSRPQRVRQSDSLTLAETALDLQENRLAEWANTAARRGTSTDRTWLIQRLALSVRNQLWDRVVAESDELRPIAGDDGPSWLMIGEASFALNRFPEAVDAYHRAASAKAEPLSSAQRESMRPKWSQLLVDLGEWEQAAPLVDLELQANPQNAGALRKHAMILRSRGQIELALNAIVEARRMLPNDERIRLLNATLLIDAQRFDEAGEILRRLIADRPHLPEPRHRYASILRQRGSMDDAATQEREAQRLSALQRRFLDLQSEWNSTRTPETARQIAEVLRQLGRAQEAPGWDHLAESQK